MPSSSVTLNPDPHAVSSGNLNHERRVLWTLFAIHFTHLLDFVLMMPLGPQFMRAFSIGPHQFSWMVSSYTYSAALFGFAGAFFLDGFDRRKALLVSYAGFAAATLGCALAPDHLRFTAARVVAGAFGGIMNATVLAIVGDVIPPSRRGSAMGLLMSAFSLASVIGVPLGLVLASHWSWHVPFFALATVATLVWGTAWVQLPPVRSHLAARGERPSGRERLAHVGNLIADRNVLRALVVTITLSLGGFTVIPFLSAYMVSNAGLAEEHLPLVYLFGGVCTFFSSRALGRASDRLGSYRVFVYSAIASMVPIVLISHLNQAPEWVVLATSTLFMVLVAGRFVPAMTLINGVVGNRDRGSYLSLSTALQNLASGFAANIGGWFVAQGSDGRMVGYDRAGWFACGCTLIAVALGARLRSETRGQSAVKPAQT